MNIKHVRATRRTENSRKCKLKYKIMQLYKNNITHNSAMLLFQNQRNETREQYKSLFLNTLIHVEVLKLLDYCDHCQDPAKTMYFLFTFKRILGNSVS